MSRRIEIILFVFCLVSFSFAIEVEFHLYSGWNLISMPCSMETGLIGDYFPVVQPSYRFIQGRGYIEIDSFPPPNSGFWYFSPVETVVSVNCECADVPLICDPSQPVVLRGDTVPEERITRNENGCVIGIDLSDTTISYFDVGDYRFTLKMLDLSDRGMLAVILSPLSHCIKLEVLDISDNWFWLSGTVDLSPLSSCVNLRELRMESCDISHIDLEPLWDLDSLRLIDLWNNFLDSASCASVCDFIREHPDCEVIHHCECE
ncbi:hypothetical protein J7M00_06365 [bacterium]|nr:hypothetical protein [bacterium]